jgi:TMEM175 potassium channel family protein
MKSGRTEAFSDGVFAIAATLLVLEIRVPVAHGDLLSALVHEWPSYASYAVSFLTIGIIWINHHAIFDHLHSVDRTLLALNLILLLLVALIPFPTALLATYLQAGHDEAAAGAVYGLGMTVMGIAFGALYAYVLRKDELRTTTIDAARKRQLLIRFTGGIPAYAAGIVVAFVSAKISLVLYAALAVYYLLDQISARRGSSSSESPVAQSRRGGPDVPHR